VRKKRIKIKKPFYKKRNFWILVFLIPIFVFLVYFFLFSNFFLVKEIEISGCPQDKERRIENLISSKLRENFLKIENIFLVDSKGIENEILDNFPQFEKVKVSKEFPQKISVKIKKRKGVFLFCKENCYLIDRKGIIFKEAEKENLLKIEKEKTSSFVLGERIISEDLILKILKIEEECEQLKIKINKISIFEEKLEAETKEGWKIILNSEKDIDFQIKKLKVVWENLEPEKRRKLEYLDLRFGDFAFPKYKITQ